eukprot:UN16788
MSANNVLNCVQWEASEKNPIYRFTLYFLVLIMKRSSPEAKSVCNPLINMIFVFQIKV